MIQKKVLGSKVSFIDSYNYNLVQSLEYNSLDIILFLVFPRFFMDNKAMEKQSTLSTNIDSDLKKALAAFCKKRGLKIQSVVENAIREQLEDEIDLASYDERKNEEEVSLASILKKLKK